MSNYWTKFTEHTAFGTTEAYRYCAFDNLRPLDFLNSGL